MNENMGTADHVICTLVIGILPQTRSPALSRGFWASVLLPTRAVSFCPLNALLRITTTGK